MEKIRYLTMSRESGEGEQIIFSDDYDCPGEDFCPPGLTVDHDRIYEVPDDLYYSLLKEKCLIPAFRNVSAWRALEGEVGKMETERGLFEMGFDWGFAAFTPNAGGKIHLVSCGSPTGRMFGLTKAICGTKGSGHLYGDRWDIADKDLGRISCKRCLAKIHKGRLGK